MSLSSRYYLDRRNLLPQTHLAFEGFVVKDQYSDLEIVFPDCWHGNPFGVDEWMQHPAMLTMHDLNEATRFTRTS